MALGGPGGRCGTPCGPWHATTAADGRYTITNIDPQTSIVTVSKYGSGLGERVSGGVSDPDEARAFTFTYGGTIAFSTVLAPQASLAITVSGVAANDYALIDAFLPPGTSGARAVTSQARA